MVNSGFNVRPQPIPSSKKHLGDSGNFVAGGATWSGRCAPDASPLYLHNVRNFRMQERRYGVTEERGRGRSMEPNHNQLTLVTQTSRNGCPSMRASAGRLPLTSNLSRSRTRKRNSTFDKRVCLFIRLELWAQALSGINQRRNSHSGTKVYAGALRLQQKGLLSRANASQLERQTGNDRPRSSQP
jgi:hypothetical protein